MKVLIKENWRKFSRDISNNHQRYHALFLLFILVYFGEVLLSSRVLHQLSSPERKFWLWWLLASACQLIPNIISLMLAILLALAILAAIIFHPSLADDFALWLFYIIVIELITNLIAAWRRR